MVLNFFLLFRISGALFFSSDIFKNGSDNVRDRTTVVPHSKLVRISASLFQARGFLSSSRFLCGVGDSRGRTRINSVSPHGNRELVI